ncbi:hypothetical protein EVAR_31442_1 [Eumeta japonica]|uniref:Uncharacterized protein n=1 Tax=Eumeta variegata TaxID=151549 RepID=A0A4C1UZ67_EUMVA|nr:hypothetical protein EVAR_31442_1 [Eumeta japonica]
MRIHRKPSSEEWIDSDELVNAVETCRTRSATTPAVAGTEFDTKYSLKNSTRCKFVISSISNMCRTNNDLISNISPYPRAIFLFHIEGFVTDILPVEDREEEPPLAQRRCDENDRGTGDLNVLS